ncbi:MAG: DNA gyrase subunit A [Clostridia bacterium]|nr:DNA gyrase subunit A [Clostridia bacterium]
MASKKTIVRNETIINQTLEEVMHNSMLPYAEYVVMERAIPRVEDGLKPVQRRILYTMRELQNFPDRPHKKSARVAGDCMGKYHPHGDSSIYDAMVRMAQDFSFRDPLVDGHGNFGSIDGDSPAAMRYTEVRMAPLALELLRDIEKDTVSFSLNFDDTLQEPDMLPGRFPNLLVNGAMGIAVGLATNIPPHNLGEVIDATIAQIDNPEISIDELMEFVPGPDFPTGGYIIGNEGAKDAYETGKGRIVIRAKASIEKISGGKSNIVITEIPYQINKASMLEKILKLSEQKKGILSFINDIRDESDRTGMRAVIEIKKDGDANKILQYLYKYSDLQTNFGVNSVAIAEGKPMLLNLKEMLAYYIEHQKDVVRRRTKFDLEKALAREHIILGLLIAIANIDEVVKIIKTSQSTQDAKRNLMHTFELTGIQAQAILDMRLARLAALEVEKLQEELSALQKLIEKLRGILRSNTKLMNVIKKELLEIKKNYATSRRTRIVKAEDKQLPSADDFVIVETIVTTVTKHGFIKRLSQNSYNRSDTTAVIEDLTGDDVPVTIFEGTTAETILLFTNTGMCYRLSANDLPEKKWKEKGVHISSLINGFGKDERIVGVLNYDKVPSSGAVIFTTKHGMIKKCEIAEFDTRTRKIIACGLNNDDEVVWAGASKRGMTVLVISRNGMALNMRQSQISTMGRSAKGVKAIDLSGDDSVLAAYTEADNGELILVTDKGYGKKIPGISFSPQNRGGKGIKTFAFNSNGSNGTHLVSAISISEPCEIILHQKSGEVKNLSSNDFHTESIKDSGKPVAIPVLGDEITKVYMHLR